MAKAKKKTAPKAGKKSLISKLKALVPRKKATPGRAIKNALQKKKSTQLELTKKADPAHAPGHRKLSLPASRGGKKTRAQNSSAENQMARDNRIARTETNERRVITGATVGKTGRLV